MLLFLFFITVVLCVILEDKGFTYNKTEHQLEAESRLNYSC